MSYTPEYSHLDFLNRILDYLVCQVVLPMSILSVFLRPDLSFCIGKVNNENLQSAVKLEATTLSTFI